MANFLPTLFVVVLSALFVFLIVPRISPFVVFILSIIFLVLALYVHIQMFGYEYTHSVWRDVLQNYSYTILIIIIALIVISYFLNILPDYALIRLPHIWKHDYYGKEKVITNTKPFSSIPIEKLIEIEKQL